MRAQASLYVTWILGLMVGVLACSKAGTDRRPIDGATAPAPASPPPASGAAPVTPRDASVSDSPGSVDPGNASGVQLGPALNDTAGRNPARDLNAQVGGSSPPAIAQGHRIATRVTLASHRALDVSSPDSSKIAGRYLATGQAAVKRCYESALANAPPTKSTLTLRFAVTTVGHVADATADSSIPALSTCVRDAMPSWTFPAQLATTRFELVLSLVPE